MRPIRWLILTTVILLTGSLNLTYAPGTIAITPEPVEIQLGTLHTSSTAGINATHATATLTGALIATTTDLWYLNNTNDTGASYVKLTLTNTPTLTGATSIIIGIDNGTTTEDQITITLGSITQTEGPYIRLDPGASGRIYATHVVTLTFSTALFDIKIRAADSTEEKALITTRAELTLT